MKKVLMKTPSLAAKEKFTARLRKARWLIYRNMNSRKRDVFRRINRYKKPVENYHHSSLGPG